MAKNKTIIISEKAHHNLVFLKKQHFLSTGEKKSLGKILDDLLEEKNVRF